MRRRTSRKNQITPTLFPFLAVLICTMGAIILLLVLVVKRADVKANAATQSNLEELDAKKSVLRDQLELETDLTEGLHELRPDLKARLAKEKTVLGHLADHVSRLKSEMERLKQTLASLSANTADETTVFQREQQIKDLKQQIAAAKVDFDERKQQVDSAVPAYSIIPNAQGGNGTFRRPIFVECDGQGVTLQPYGITLRPSDFPRSMGPDNPLDLALLMIRDYWNQIDPGQSAGQPYPLFVIRPTGSKAFATARKAMKSWVDEFGYELVDAHINIKYPEPDKAFKDRLTTAVNQARLEQESRLAFARKQQALAGMRRLGTRASSSQGYRASSTSGGFVRERNTGLAAGSSARDSVFSSASQRNFGGQSSEFAANSQGGGFTRGTPNKDQAIEQGAERNSSFQPFDSDRKSAADASQRQRRAGSGGPNNSPSGQPNFSPVGNPADAPAQSIAQSRGKDWALPSKANNSIQIRKPIKVQVNRDSIQIVEIGRGVKTIPFQQDTSSAVPVLVEQVWKHIDAWGIAGVNSYWRPTLNLYVAPDAEARFNELQVLLSGSGLDLRRAR